MKHAAQLLDAFSGLSVNATVYSGTVVVDTVVVDVDVAVTAGIL